ncbi:MAG: LON peptidase substrate-binding domain-containing protein [Planctomycetota bacterium]|nr:LON peptidase substrate-binding domain-containing protein [Planctomycetota bacterium]
MLRRTGFACYRGGVAQEIEKAPLFPLPKGAILPGELLPLHIFEPRYRAMMQAVRDGDQLIAIGTLHPGNTHDVEGRPLISDIVGLGQLLRDEQNDDGTSDIVLHGIGRGRITQELPSAPFRTVRFDRQPITTDDHPAVTFRLRRQLLNGLASHMDQPIVFDVTARFDVGTLADRIASSLRLAASQRIAMMQAFSSEARVELLLNLLEDPRHGQRLIDLIPSLQDFSLSLPDAKDTSR